MPPLISGLPVAGYKDQTKQRVDLVNENKFTEERLLRMIDDLQHNKGLLDPHMAQMARNHFELGYMCLNRAIFRPDRAKLPED